MRHYRLYYLNESVMKRKNISLKIKVNISHVGKTINNNFNCLRKKRYLYVSKKKIIEFVFDEKSEDEKMQFHQF